MAERVSTSSHLIEYLVSFQFKDSFISPLKPKICCAVVEIFAEVEALEQETLDL